MGISGEGLRVAWVTTMGGGQFLGLSGDRKGKNGRGGGGDLEVISESIRLRDVKAVREGERRAE